MKVSVIMPTYNRPDLIMDALDSYVEQDSVEKELIVINDGSTKDYSSVERLLKDIGARYYKTENKGEPHAVNVGIHAATGDLVCLLHDDDMFTANSLSRRAWLFQNGQTKVVWGDSLKLMPGGELEICKSGPPSVARIWASDFISGNATMWRRQIHDMPNKPFGYYDESLKNEYDYDIKLRFHLWYQRDGGCAYFEEPVVINRIHGDRLTSRYFESDRKAQTEYVHQKYIKMGYSRG